MTGDSVVKTLLILFAVAISPFVVALLAIVAYAWFGLAASHA
jgi:hypothetical protein